MTDEVLSDPESKTLVDSGLPEVPDKAKTVDVGDSGGVGGEGGEERWKRERWTRHESMALVSAMKQLEDDATTTSTGGDAKWKSISQICSTHAVQRTSVQCRKRWNTLLAAYKKIKDWERRNAMESYWAIGGLDCKAKKLPAGFDEEIWNVMNSFLAGRAGMSPRLFAYKTDEQPSETISAAAVPRVEEGAPSLQPSPEPSPGQDNQRKKELRKRGKDSDGSKKRKMGLQEIQSVSEPESNKLPKLDEQNAGSHRFGFEALDPFPQFLSTFLEKSLEAYERNSELNRKVSREQGENLVAVLGSLSSAVRDLVHSSVLQK